jgi:heme-degrading monooxygenase HmoA
MPAIISVHEYALKREVDAEAFEDAVHKAQERGLFQLPGLLRYHFLRGIKGDRCDRYAAVWVYESREAWESLWGPAEEPHPKDEYPEKWKVWEDEFLTRFLSEDPDTITYTSYETFLSRG